MDTQCNIRFHEKNKEVKIPTLSATKETIDLEQAISFVENSPLNLDFTAEKEAKLILADLTFYPTEQQQIIYVYKNQHHYPFTTGYYIGELHINDVIWYFPFYVASKIKSEHHKKMVLEVEQFLTYFSRTAGHGITLLDDISINYIVKQEKVFIRAIQQLIAHPKTEIEVSYELQLPSKVKKKDIRTLQYAQRHPNETKVYAPIKKQIFDILENQLLKQMLQKCKLTFAQYLQKSAVNDPDLAQLLQRILYHIELFLQTDWVENLDIPYEFAVPVSFFQLPNYETIFQMLRQIKNPSQQSQNYVSRSIKSSSEIYEIWCYIKLIASYENLGYKITVNNLSFTYDQQQVYFNTAVQNYVQLEKEEACIRLFFEDSIPRFRTSVQPLSPLYTMHNNQPDCRIDFWKSGNYRGSHLIDFKYRKMEYIWKKARNENQHNETIQQLSSYAIAMQSNSSLLNGKLEILLDRMPTKEAWALYPYNDNFSNSELKDFQIRLIPFTPAEDNEQFEARLKEITANFLS